MDTMGLTDELREHIPPILPGLLEKQYGAELAGTILRGFSLRRRVTLRANTIKATIEEVRAALAEAGISFRAVPWYSDALILEDADESTVRALPLYEEGRIYLQSLSSMLPPLLLAPGPGSDILDMAAAPGSKTTQMAALSGNRAHITACEMNPIRAKRLQYNIEKQGASCVYVMQKDARTLDDFFAFDQILLDAPCSGSGVLNLRDRQLCAAFTQRRIDQSVKAQRALLKKALRLLKKGQELVYSTCSVLSCENEEIVTAALSGGAELVPVDGDLWPDIPRLPVQIKGTLCVAPDELFEGFFIAKLRAK